MIESFVKIGQDNLSLGLQYSYMLSEQRMVEISRFGVWMTPGLCDGCVFNKGGQACTIAYMIGGRMRLRTKPSSNKPNEKCPKGITESDAEEMLDWVWR